jgi:hypothetical protein
MDLANLTPDTIHIPLPDVRALHQKVHQLSRVSDQFDMLGNAHQVIADELIRQGEGHGTPINFMLKEKPLLIPKARPIPDQQPEPTRQVMSSNLSGLYIKTPHGRLCQSGQKRAIAQVRSDKRICGEKVIVSKENGVGLAFGIATIGEPLSVPRSEFNEYFDQHRVTQNELAKWWKDSKQLFIYPIENFEPYDVPREVVVEAGTQLLMGKVQFKDISDVGEDSDMPWTASDAERFTSKANTAKKRKLWAEVANERLAACLKDGGEKDKCEASAIKQANSVVAKAKEIEAIEATAQAIQELESAADLADQLAKATEVEQSTCTCPNCGSEEDHEPGTACSEVECSCGSMMRGASIDDTDKEQTQETTQSHVGEPEPTPEPQISREEAVEMLAQLVDAAVNKRLQQTLPQAEPEVKEEVLVEVESIPEPKPEPESKSMLATIREKIELAKGFIADLATGDTAFQPLPSVSAFKAKDGKTWLMLWVTNSYRDRDGEIFREQALKDYVGRYTDQSIKGEFWYRHIPGTKFGTVQWQSVVADRFLVQLGTFDDTPIGNAFKQFLTNHPSGHPSIAPKGWGASHGYNYIADDRRDGVYNWLNIGESSILSAQWASNVYNPQPTILGGKDMDDKATAELNAISEEVGTDLVALVTQTAEQKKSELDSTVDHKEVDSEPETKEAITKSEPEPDIGSVELQASEPEQATSDESKQVLVTEIVNAVKEAFGMDSLSEQFASQQQDVAEIKSAVEALTGKVATLEQTDETRVAEAVRTLPKYDAFSWMRASKDESTLLNDSDELTDAGPKIAEDKSSPVAALAERAHRR